jgi:dipeptidyl aminopeptidase/acylaminoacyl peptidase
LERLLFSSKQGFPYLTTMMKSTLRALDLVATRGFIEQKRVGIGGLSQGSGNPLYMLVKEDRIAAASIAGGYIGPWMYYSATPRRQPRSEEWYPAPIGEGLTWWNPIDVALHVRKIQAPILFNIPDQEIEANTTLLRHLEDAHKPFDAYVFPGEYHEKWQSAHRQAIYRRNLDWFRFWLQGYEDPAAENAEQYRRWEKLCDMQRAQNPDRPAFCVRSKTH